MRTRKKEKQIAEKILTKVMESGMLLNGNGHFVVHEVRGKITCIEIYNGLFSPESEIGEVILYVTPSVHSDGEGNECSIDFRLQLSKKCPSYFYSLYLQKDKSDVLRKFF